MYSVGISDKFRIVQNSDNETPIFTKGEWYLQTKADSCTNIIRCKNEKHDTIYIGSCTQSSSLESQANAQLMAAAPDLLLALELVVVRLEWRMENEPGLLDKSDYEMYDACQKAIAKALTIQEKSVF